MTSRERIKAALMHMEPDRTPMFEYVLLPPVASALLGRPYVDYAGDPEGWNALAREKGWESSVRKYAADRTELASLLGHDMMYVVPCPVEHAYLKAPAGMPKPEKRAEGPVERLIQRNEMAEQAADALCEDSLFIYGCMKEEQQKRCIDLPILAPAYAHGVWTDVDLMETMLLAPDVARRHFALATGRAMKLIDRYIGLGLDMAGVGGDFAGNRPIISPRSYREFIVPEVRKLSDRLRAAGRWSVNASDGNLWSVMDDFLSGCGVDGYLEIDSNAGMDLKRLKAEYGDAFTLFGNMDCGSALSFGTPDEIRRLTLKCLEDGAGRGGHVFCASNAITSSVPTGNYLAMAQAYRECFGLPKLKLPA